MGKGIEIGVASETKAFKQGVESGIITPLEDAVEALDDLGKADGAEKLERAMESAQDASKDLKREVERTASDIEAEFRRSYKKVGDSSNEGMGHASENVQEFKREALSNFSEVTSSFDGSMSSIQDLAQGTLGGLAAGIAGPVGLVAGGVAAGVGLAGGAFTSMTEQSEQMKENVSENFREMADNGIEAWGSLQSETQRLTDAYADHEDEIKKIAEITGLSFEQVASAWAGNKDAIDRVTAAYDEALAKQTEFASAEDAEAFKLMWGAAIKPLNDVTDGYDKAREKAERLAAQQSEIWKSAIAGADEASVEVDEFGNKLVTLPDGTQVLIEAETKVATQNLDKFKGDVDGVPETVKTTAILDMDTYGFDRKIAEYRDQRITIRADIVDRYGKVIE